MARQNISTGTTPNDGTGDTLRVAFTKTNNNFTELYSQVSNVSKTISNTWVSPQTSNTYNLINMSGASRVVLPVANTETLTTYATRNGTDTSSLYIPKTTQINNVLQPIYDEETEISGLSISINELSSQGTIAGSDEDEWNLTFVDNLVSYSINDTVEILITYIKTPQPWFNPQTLGITDFRAAKIDYHAYVDNANGFNRVGEIMYATALDNYSVQESFLYSTNTSTQNVSLSVRNGTDSLHYKNISIPSGNLHIQWTAKIWTGKDAASG